MPLRHTLLGLLSIAPMHGYRLRRHARHFAWIYPMANASIYPALHALEREGAVRHRSEILAGRARKVYEITDSGRAELERWLCESNSEEPALHDPMLLKIAMQTDATAASARTWMERVLVDLRKKVENYDRQMAARDASEKYTELVIQYGADVLRLRMQLLMRALEVVEAAESAVPKTPAIPASKSH